MTRYTIFTTRRPLRWRLLALATLPLVPFFWLIVTLWQGIPDLRQHLREHWADTKARS